MSRIVVLRPESGASETVARAKARGLDAIAIPLFAVEAMEWQAPDAHGFDALLLTSANAVRFGGERLASLRGLPVHAVGAATADAARDAGFDIASSGEAGVERLLASLEPDLNLLHLCGEDRTTSDGARQSVTVRTVYRSRAIEPSPRVDTANDAAVLIHSPRAAERFANLAAEQGLDRSKTTILAISKAAADAAGAGWKSVEAAEQPTDDALLALAERLCDNRRQG